MEDLCIDFDNLRQSRSKIGYAYEIDPRLNGAYILCGSYTNWEINEVEIY